MPSDFPQLIRFVADKCQRHDVKNGLDNVQVSGGIDCVHNDGVEHKIDEREDDHAHILIERSSYAIRMKMDPEVGIVLVLVLDEIGRVTLFLAEPAVPEVLDAFLVARGADDSQRMEVNCTLNDIGGTGVFPVSEDRVAPQQALFEQELLVFFGFDTARISILSSMVAIHTFA